MAKKKVSREIHITLMGLGRAEAGGLKKWLRTWPGEERSYTVLTVAKRDCRECWRVSGGKAGMIFAEKLTVSDEESQLGWGTGLTTKEAIFRVYSERVHKLVPTSKEEGSGVLRTGCGIMTNEHQSIVLGLLGSRERFFFDTKKRCRVLRGIKTYVSLTIINGA